MTNPKKILDRYICKQMFTCFPNWIFLSRLFVLSCSFPTASQFSGRMGHRPFFWNIRFSEAEDFLPMQIFLFLFSGEEDFLPLLIFLVAFFWGGRFPFHTNFPFVIFQERKISVPCWFYFRHFYGGEDFHPIQIFWRDWPSKLIFLELKIDPQYKFPLHLDPFLERTNFPGAEDWPPILFTLTQQITWCWRSPLCLMG